MTNYEISQLTAKTTPGSGDLFVLVDVTDMFTPPAGAGGSDKKITFADLSAAIGVSSSLLQPTGSASADAALINGAVAALPVINGESAGTVDMAAGHWHLAAGGVTAIDSSTVTLRWQPGALVTCTGTGDVIRMYDGSDYNSRTGDQAGGGIQGNPTFNISAMTGVSSAFHAGDILGLQGKLSVDNNGGVAGQHGIRLDNNYYWTEQAEIECRMNGCSVALDNSADTSGQATGSFDRMDLRIWTLNQGMADALAFLNDAFIFDPVQVGIYGNFSPASNSTVYYSIRFSGTSSIQNGPINIGVEYDGSGGTTASTILFTASPYNFIANCWGMLDWSSGSFTAAPQNGGSFQFFGTVLGDDVLTPAGAYAATSTSVTVGGGGTTVYAIWFPVIYADVTTASTGCILYPGGYDAQTTTIINTGTATMTFAASGTSNVALGAAVSIAAGASRSFLWNDAKSLWY